MKTRMILKGIEFYVLCLGFLREKERVVDKNGNIQRAQPFPNGTPDRAQRYQSDRGLVGTTCATTIRWIISCVSSATHKAQDVFK